MDDHDLPNSRIRQRSRGGDHSSAKVSIWIQHVLNSTRLDIRWVAVHDQQSFDGAAQFGPHITTGYPVRGEISA